MTATRPAHVLTLDPGDRFSFRPGGEVFRRVAGPDDRVWIEPADPGRAREVPAHVLEYEFCFVYPIEGDDGPSEEED